MRRKPRGHALRRRYGRSDAGSKKLNVVRRGRNWVITGLSSGRDLTLDLHLAYPQTEWPEIGSIEGAESMLHALYDLWQTSDALEREAPGAVSGKGPSLRFHTPYGDFVTVGVGVVPAEDAPKALAALKLYNEQAAEIDRIEHEVMAAKGFGPERMAAIYAAHGGSFADWPPGLEKEWQVANSAAFQAAEPIRAKLRARTR